MSAKSIGVVLGTVMQNIPDVLLSLPAFASSFLFVFLSAPTYAVPRILSYLKEQLHLLPENHHYQQYLSLF